MMTRKPPPSAWSQPRALWNRLLNSAVAWSWGFNALRLASGMILLPLVLNKLTTAEVGMYFVLLSLAAIVPLVDFGFGPTVGRFVSYAMGGAETIQAHGVASPGTASGPNYRMLWELLATTRVIYRWLTLLLLVVLGAWGTYMVELRIQETASPLVTRLAWAATLGTALFDLYSNWWVIYLRSMNEVVAATRIAVLAGVYDRRGGQRVDAGLHAVPGPVRGLRHRRVLHAEGPANRKKMPFWYRITLDKTARHAILTSERV